MGLCLSSGIITKGWIDGTRVAVEEILPKDLQGEQKCLGNITYPAKLSRPNLVELIGFYLEDHRCLLVYKFTSSVSMEYLLHGFHCFPPPSWNLYMKAALGAAKGLAFLHGVGVTYEDFNPSEILLDSNCNGKLRGFRLTKDKPTCDKTRFYARVLGTAGYAAPDLINTGTLTSKSNVYSFGIILLEILTGKPALWLTKLSKDPVTAQTNPLVFNPNVSGLYSTTTLQKAAQLAFQCVSEDPRLRPDMIDVVRVLEKLMWKEKHR